MTNLRRAWSGLSRRTHRLVALTAALALVAVPTIWAVFPWLSQLWILWRALVLVGWGLAAVAIVASTDRQARQVDELMGETERRRRRERKKAGDVAIGLLLQGSVFIGHDLNLAVYLPLPSGDLAVEYSSQVPPEHTTWTPPHGATGFAFSAGRRVIARGRAARDDTYLLSDEEKRRAANLAVVAAEPITNQSARTFGVLTIYGVCDDGFLATPDGVAEHQALAEAIARLLIDVCNVASDDVTTP